MNDIINAINSYKYRSNDKLINQQNAYIPTIEENQVECMVQGYIIGDKTVMVDQSRYICIKLSYLKFMPITPRDHMSYINKTWGMEYLVEYNIIHPFALFINGYNIPWDMMSIVIGYNTYYILIDLEYNYSIANNIIDTQFAQIVKLPDTTYMDSESNDDNLTIFSFNSDGEYDTTNSVYEYKLNTNRILLYTFNTDTGVNALQIDENRNITLSEDNVILFKNGLLATGKKYGIYKTTSSSYYNEDLDIDVPYLDFKDAEVVDDNPIIRFDSTLLTINDGAPDGNIYNVLVFINKKFTDNINNISRIDLGSLEEKVKDINNGSTPEEYWDELKENFSFAMDRSKDYNTNVTEAIYNIIAYNTSLFNDVFKKKSNLKIEEYTGEEINSMAVDGAVTFIRQHDIMHDEFIMVLHNGVMYEYYYSSYYDTNKFILPIHNVEDTDIIEILRFQNVNNNVYDIVINEDDDYKEYLPEIINNEMILFSDETDNNYFEFPENGLQHFPVNYTINYNSEGKLKIVLENPFYYGKNLKIAYKNRFKHFWFNLSETTDKYTVNLEDKFMYCNDYAKYLVFYNGRRLGSDHFRLTLPVRDTTPFYNFNIYLTLPIKEGDRLDIIYVPSLMKDVIMTPTIPTSGDIVINKSIVNYGLSRDLYMIWINGKKVPLSHIVDIDSTYMRIITDEKSTDVMCITKYIPDIDAICEVFNSTTSIWDTITELITDNEISNMLGIESTDIVPTEENVYADAINIKAIMYELIREEFMMNELVDITEPFIYDYQDADQSIIEDYDSANNAILTVSDSNNTDNLDDVERPWP